MNNPLTAMHLKPYLCLEDDGEGPLMRHGPLLCFENLVQGKSYHPTQRLLSGSFRANLQRVVGKECAVKDPRETDCSRRSTNWAVLCDAIDSYNSITEDEQARVLRVLLYLGFYSLIRKLAPPLDVARLSNISFASKWIITAGAGMMLAQGGRFGYDPTELLAIAEHAPDQSLAKFTAARALVVFFARERRDAERVMYYRAMMDEFISSPANCRSQFDYCMYLSGYYRAASYLPMLRGDMSAMVAEMNECERIGYEAVQVAESEQQRIVAREGLHPIYESRMREALVLGDTELAHDRACKMCELDPLDSKAWIELGESYYRKGEFKSAAESFAYATSYGPPGLEVATFLLAESLERLGRPFASFCEYAELGRIDRGSKSVRRRVSHSVAPGMRSIADWLQGQ